MMRSYGFTSEVIIKIQLRHPIIIMIKEPRRTVESEVSLRILFKLEQRNDFLTLLILIKMDID